MKRGPAPGSVGYPKDIISHVAYEAYMNDESMARAVAAHFGVSEQSARSLISRARLAGYRIPTQLGWNSGTPRAACGTPGAYRRHLKRGEEPCDACRADNAARKRRARKTGSEQTPVELPDRDIPAPVTGVVLQCGCGWTSDNATAMVWHCRTVHDRRATVDERTPKVSL